MGNKENKKMYLLIGDEISPEDYGIDGMCYGLFDSFEDALNTKEKVEKERGEALGYEITTKITEINTNEKLLISLGAYIE